VKNLETNKTLIRKEALNRRKSLSEQEREMKNQLIIEKLMTVDAYKTAQNILIYASYNYEVDTDLLILKSMVKGKKIYMPKVDGDDMEFYRVFSLDELKAGAFGIREPYDIEHFMYLGDSKSLCILPLASFDDCGNRVGYGKGYYDKYLAKRHVDSLIGIAYECQKTDVLIEVDEFDKKLDYVITESNIFRY